MLKKELWGIKLIGLLNLVFGAIGIIFYFFVLLYVPLRASQITGFKYAQVLGGTFQNLLFSRIRTFEFFALLGERLFSSGLAFITGIGILNLKNWARRIFIISSATYGLGNTIIYLYTLTILRYVTFPVHLFLLKVIILGVVLFYFTCPSIRKHFV